MVKIKMFGVRKEEEPIALAWADRHQVEISMTSEILSSETVDQVQGFDGVSLSQVVAIEDPIYAQLKAMGIKQLAQRSAGVDMYNLVAAKENGIIVTNVPSYSPESIAEYTALVALSIIRKYDLIQSRVRDHNFSWTPEIRGQVVGDMKVAIIGTGRIGQCLAKIFKGFGSEIVGFDLFPNDNLKDLLDYKDSVEAAIEDADIISIHMPATPETHHMFNADLFAKFKPGAVLMNMARGSVVDTEDLLSALDQGLLLGAGIDTYEFEGPYVPKNLTGQDITDELFLRLINHPKVIYSPHIAYYTDEAVKNLVEGGLDATLEIIETGNTRNRVN